MCYLLPLFLEAECLKADSMGAPPEVQEAAQPLQPQDDQQEEP